MGEKHWVAGQCNAFHLVRIRKNLSPCEVTTVISSTIKKEFVWSDLWAFWQAVGMSKNNLYAM